MGAMLAPIQPGRNELMLYAGFSLGGIVTGGVTPVAGRDMNELRAGLAVLES